MKSPGKYASSVGCWRFKKYALLRQYDFGKNFEMNRARLSLLLTQDSFLLTQVLIRLLLRKGKREFPWDTGPVETNRALVPSRSWASDSSLVFSPLILLEEECHEKYPHLKIIQLELRFFQIP